MHIALNETARFLFHQKAKTAPTVVSAQKRKFRSSPNKPYTEIVFCHTFIAWNLHFIKFVAIKVLTKKDIPIPLFSKENTPIVCIFRLFGFIIISYKIKNVNTILKNTYKEANVAHRKNLSRLTPLSNG